MPKTLAGQFALLRQVQDELREWTHIGYCIHGDVSDMAQAIAAGSTMVRVGTAIFGARHYHA
jgi:uncharacterized pyridoxal phosphate-containing UPF0001 family protein